MANEMTPKQKWLAQQAEREEREHRAMEDATTAPATPQVMAQETTYLPDTTFAEEHDRYIATIGDELGEHLKGQPKTRKRARGIVDEQFSYGPFLDKAFTLASSAHESALLKMARAQVDMEEAADLAACIASLGRMHEERVMNQMAQLRSANPGRDDYYNARGH